MSTGLHKDLDIGENHRTQSLTYANAAARTGATGLTADDVGRDAIQTDNSTFWKLTDHSPVTWIQLGAGGVSLASTPPADVTKAAAAVGTGTTAARDDHKHDISTAAASTIGTANAEGSATSLARSDHGHDHGAQTTATHHAVATTGANGFMSSTDKTKLDGVASGASKAILTWGDDSITTSTTTRYLTPGFDDGTAETTETAYRVPSAGTAQNLRVRARVAGTGAATLTYTLMQNGSPTSLSVAMSNTVQDGSDLVNTVTLSAGDLISIRVTKSASLTSDPDDIMASLEVAA